MSRVLITRVLIALGVLVTLAAWPAGAVGAQGSAGAVYTMTNQASGNAVAVFERAADGSLSPAGVVPTGGLGTGGALGNQGALALSDGGRFLFVVNAGSDNISSFRVREDGLSLVGVVPSQGDVPISLTVDKKLLYVLNAGDADTAGNIAGFRIQPSGELSPIAGSIQPLSGASVDPAQIAFHPSGRVLAVTEKATNLIDVYTVDRDGIASGPATHQSSGQTPFGFAFDRQGLMVVSEAFGGTASALSSYDVTRSGDVSLISASVFAGAEKAACWVVITGNGRYAYTTNTGSGSISGYSIAPDGSLALLDPDGRTAMTGGAPIDAALSRNSRFLYVLNAALTRIDAFGVEADGSLTPLPAAGVGELPAGVNGLVAT